MEEMKTEIYGEPFWGAEIDGNHMGAEDRNDRPQGRKKDNYYKLIKYPIVTAGASRTALSQSFVSAETRSSEIQFCSLIR